METGGTKTQGWCEVLEGWLELTIAMFGQSNMHRYFLDEKLVILLSHKYMP